MKRNMLAFSFVLLLLVACAAAPTGSGGSHPSTVPRGATGTPSLGVSIKMTGCVAHAALPDRACTPGAVLPVTTEQVCQPGYSRSVRNVPESEKTAVFLSYGVTSRTTGEYEVDHLISLELGGSNVQANLWPEAATPVPGFHEKDKVENALHSQVCSGKMTLAEAQREIATNWLAVYQTLSP